MFTTTMQAKSAGGGKMPAEKAERDGKRRQEGNAEKMAREEKGEQGGKGRLRAEQKARDEMARAEKEKLDAARQNVKQES